MAHLSDERGFGVPRTPGPEPMVWFLGVHGTLIDGDLAVQAFARHVAEHLPTDDAVTLLIGGMRGFLEHRPNLVPAGTNLGAVQTGHEAVRVLARSLGVPDARVTEAERAGRLDVARTAFALEAPDGLLELVTAAGRVSLALLVEPDEHEVATEVVAAVLPRELADRIAVVAAGPDDVRGWGGTGPRFVLAAAWTPLLADLAAAGAVTVVVDRFERRVGTPALRVGGIADVHREMRRWADDALAAPDPAADRS